jgi:hypothetical protein
MNNEKMKLCENDNRDKNDNISIVEKELNEEELRNNLDKIMIDDIKKIENKNKEIIKFFYFSELDICGSSKKIHQEYCDKMIENNYTLVKITPLGNLDMNRDSYEGTLIYHWKINDINN